MSLRDCSRAGSDQHPRPNLCWLHRHPGQPGYLCGIQHGHPCNFAKEAQRGVWHHRPGFAMDKFTFILEKFLNAGSAIVVSCYFMPGRRRPALSARAHLVHHVPVPPSGV